LANEWNSDRNRVARHGPKVPVTANVFDGQLLFDVGCHRGDDTAYYLRKGFRVIAVEANPTLFEECRSRFPGEIAAGRLQVLHRCVSDVREEVTFFINANDGWSSFIEPIGRRGGNYEGLTMVTVPLDELLREFGVPYFMKVDVEGAEDRLLRALRRNSVRPVVLAIEIDFYAGDPIGDLEILGYSRFRFIRQPHLEPDPELPGWAFSRCSSGPLNAATLRGMSGAEEARQQLAAIRGQSYRWHDLYATNGTSYAAAGWPHPHGPHAPWRPAASLADK